MLSMLKKFFIAVGILTVLGVAGLFFAGNKFESVIKEREPEFRQYLTMTAEEQNAYVEKNLGELISIVGKIKGANIGDSASVIEFFKQYPDVSEALILEGRSIVATFILMNEDILKDISAEVHNQLQAESDQLDARNDRMKELIQKYDPRKN